MRGLLSGTSQRELVALGSLGEGTQSYHPSQACITDHPHPGAAAAPIPMKQYSTERSLLLLKVTRVREKLPASSQPSVAQAGLVNPSPCAG